MYETSITVDQVIDYLATFISPFVPGAEVVRAQVNRVPMPPNPCVVLTEILQRDLSIPYMDYTPPVDPIPAVGTATISGPTQFDIQVDFYGPLAGDFCKAVKSAYRSQWAFSQFPANIKPLYTSEGHQAPLTTGEQQYESRWTITVSIQYNPTVIVPQEFAEEVTVESTEPVDIFTSL